MEVFVSKAEPDTCVKTLYFELLNIKKTGVSQSWLDEDMITLQST